MLLDEHKNFGPVSSPDTGPQTLFFQARKEYVDTTSKSAKVNTHGGQMGHNGKRSTTKPQQDSNQSEKKSKPLPIGIKEKHLCNWLNGLPAFKFKFNQTFRVWHPPLGEPQIIQYVPESRTVRIAAHEHMATEIGKANLPEDYVTSFSETIACVKRWKWSTPLKLTKWPKPIGFHSDQDLMFSRLPFDPAPIYSFKDFPIINEILSRMSDSNAFCSLIGQCFLEDAPRKQVIWLYGESNSGKSFLLNNVVAKICGGEQGTATFSGEALSGAHWKEPLLGKTLLIVNEAPSKFIRGDAFKSLTGDDSHMINPKGLKMFQGILACRTFFSSNEEPEIPKDETLACRILSCRISAFQGGKLAPQTLERKVQRELPYFVAHCIDLAKKLEGSEIKPSDQARAELEEAMASFDEELQHVFDLCFILDKTAWISSHQLQNRIVQHLNKGRGITMNRFRQFILNTYGLRPKMRKDFSRGYWGLKERLLN